MNKAILTFNASHLFLSWKIDPPSYSPNPVICATIPRYPVLDSLLLCVLTPLEQVRFGLRHARLRDHNPHGLQ